MQIEEDMVPLSHRMGVSMGVVAPALLYNIKYDSGEQC